MKNINEVDIVVKTKAYGDYCIKYEKGYEYSCAFYKNVNHKSTCSLFMQELQDSEEFVPERCSQCKKVYKTTYLSILDEDGIRHFRNQEELDKHQAQLLYDERYDA